MYLIPKEILNIILMLGDCASIIQISETSKYYRNHIKSDNLFIKRKYLGYPRKNGCCKILSYPMMMEDYRKIDYEFTDDEKSNIFNDMLLEVRRETSDIVRGDIITTHPTMWYNEGKYIFNGYKIIQLDENTINYDKILNKEFTINECKSNNYWDNGLLTYEYYWYDCVDFKNELINNIKIKNNIISTSNSKYQIIYDPSDDNHDNYYGLYDNIDISLQVKKFRTILDTFDKLLLKVINDKSMTLYGGLEYYS